MLHEEAVDTVLLDLARQLTVKPSMGSFALAGGTALALQLGHRMSVDLDFFSREDFDFRAIRSDLESWEGGRVLRAEDGTVTAEISGAKIDILRHRYPVIEEIIERDGLRLLALPDIAAMKLLAISSRGSKKDFFDIHALLEEFSMAQLLDFFAAKYPKMETFQVIMSLTYFQDAEGEPDPRSLRKDSWGEVKKRVCEAVARY